MSKRVESLLPRAILFNAAIYALVALLYSVSFFALETSYRGRYVFAARESTLRDIFNNIAICSWPVLLFGALILIAVRIGARVRKGRRKRDNDSKSSSPTGSVPNSRSRTPSPASRHHIDPPLTAPPLQAAEAEQEAPLTDTEAGEGKKSRRKGRRKRKRVPKGYVSLTRSQRLFAAAGFLWVSIGLALTATAAVFVFLGMRERSKDAAVTLGVERTAWKDWVIPIVCGMLVAVVLSFLALTTLIKVFTTLTAKPKKSRSSGEQSDDVEEAEDAEEPFISDDELGDVPMQPGGRSNELQTETRERPDQAKIDRLVRQLRDLGFADRRQTIRALELSSYDLELASDLLGSGDQ